MTASDSSEWAVINADSGAFLKTLPDAGFDALVTDPPAGIGFMGKEWDGDKGGRQGWVGWLTGIMRECLRVLKPGAHGLVWALPRTSHWTATALEDAGFEIRDVITHHFGTGFPKSLDVSKAIDAAAGADREVVGSKVGLPGYSLKHQGAGGTLSGRADGSLDNSEGECSVTAPATPAAKQWAGWGTALKPASEHWILVRKPLDGTVAANVQRHGTGALNIDGCRIGTEIRTNAAAAVNKPGGNAYNMGVVGMPQDALPKECVGRWPANLVLSHGDGCGDTCAEGCPVAELDGQNGSSNAGGLGDSGGASRFFKNFKPEDISCRYPRNAKDVESNSSPSVSAGDSAENLVLEQSMQPDKNTYQERSTIVIPGESRLNEERPTQTILSTDQRFSPESKPTNTFSDGPANCAETREPIGTTKITASLLRCDSCAALVTSESMSRSKAVGALDFQSRFTYCAKPSRRERGEGNTHPTVKAKTLMDYLIRLITPPGGLILDPFCGSGSTGVASVAGGWSFLGIEQSSEFAKIAEGRIALVAPGALKAA